MNVQLFIPCFIDQLYPSVGFNMVKVLEKAGCTVSYNPSQTCCGQPAFNAGFWADAADVCSKFLNDFAGDDPIVAPSASCVGFVRNYYLKMFEGNAEKAIAIEDLRSRIFEFSDFMVNQLKVEDVGAQLEATITYHDSCAALRECSIKNEPRRLLSRVRGLTMAEMNDVETCCGFGGTFAVKFEPISSAMASQKMQHATDTGAQYLVSTDVSCLMHIEGYARKHGIPLTTMHLADVLASGW